MLYVFQISNTGFVKMGYTRGNPWRRAATGFWSNIHPTECCHNLGWENLQLLALYDGSEIIEAAIKEALPPTRGEFWSHELLPALLRVLGFLCSSLPLPSKPSQPPPVDRHLEKLPCCGAPTYTCSDCGRAFNRHHHLVQHREGHMNVNIACTACGRTVLKRNLKRHQARCKH
jgi:DNA-directed RNA polymerase subunit RPC12/RpoP